MVSWPNYIDEDEVFVAYMWFLGIQNVDRETKNTHST